MLVEGASRRQHKYHVTAEEAAINYRYLFDVRSSCAPAVFPSKSTMHYRYSAPPRQHYHALAASVAGSAARRHHSVIYHQPPHGATSPRVDAVGDARQAGGRQRRARQRGQRPRRLPMRMRERDGWRGAQQINTPTLYFDAAVISRQCRKQIAEYRAHDFRSAHITLE